MKAITQEVFRNSALSNAAQQSMFCLEQAIATYSAALKNCQRAQRYLEETRGLNWQWLHEHFNAGFGDRTLGKTFPTDSVHENTAIRGALRRVGFTSANGREKFRGCVTFPIRNLAGEVLNIYGRKISSHLRRNSLSHVVMKPMEAEFFNQQVMGSRKSVVLCSSPIEALTLIQMGAENVISMCGLDQFTPQQIEHLIWQKIKTVEVAFSNTCRANRYASKVISQLDKADIRFRRTSMPFGEDINSLHLKARELGCMLNTVH